MTVLLVDLCSASRDDMAQTLLLAQGLRARGRDCLLACPEGSVVARAAAERGLSLASLPGNKLSLRLWRALGRTIRAGDVVLVHTLDEASLLVGALQHRRWALPFVHTLRATEEKRQRLWAWSLRQADALVETGAGRAGLREIDGLDGARVKTILPSMPLSGLDACPPRRERPDGRFIFVASGALIPEKGWNSLLQAMAYLQNMAIDLPPWEVRIVGAGPLFQSLLDSAEKLGVLGRMSLLGWQSRRNFLPDADAVLIASSGGEGDVPLVLDAWICGLPVACTALPAHQAIGEEKVSLLFSPPSNPVALAGSMLRLMQEPELRTRLIAGGTAAAEHFYPDRMAEAYAQLYDEVLRRTAPRCATAASGAQTSSSASVVPPALAGRTSTPEGPSDVPAGLPSGDTLDEERGATLS